MVRYLDVESKQEGRESSMEAEETIHRGWERNKCFGGCKGSLDAEGSLKAKMLRGLF